MGPQDELVHEGARLLASWLALELLVKYPDEVARGLREGNLAARLGVAVLDAHARFREAASEEIAERTTYFKDALNEVLAGGQRVF